MWVFFNFKYVAVANECITTYNKIFLSLYLMDLQVLGCDVLSQESSATVTLFYCITTTNIILFVYNIN